jgi:hypothetical protein
MSYRRWLKARMNDMLTSLPQAVELEIMSEALFSVQDAITAYRTQLGNGNAITRRARAHHSALKHR